VGAYDFLYVSIYTSLDLLIFTSKDQFSKYYLVIRPSLVWLNDHASHVIYQLRTAKPSSYNLDLLAPALVKGNSDCVQVLTLVSPTVFHYPANHSVSFKANLAYSDVADRLYHDKAEVRDKRRQQPICNPFSHMERQR
jgi:hypothetical protein